MRRRNFGCVDAPTIDSYHYTGTNGEEWSSDLVDFVQRKFEPHPPRIPQRVVPVG